MTLGNLMPFSQLNRRGLIAGLGGAAAWPVVARAQQPSMVIGFLSGASRDGTTSSAPNGLRKGLAEAGYTEGSNLTIEYRWADAHFDRLPALVDELVSRRVALIATVTLPAGAGSEISKPDDASYLRGHLLSYGPSIPEAYRVCGFKITRILLGARPADLPIEQSTKLILTINLKTAKAFGLEVPSTLLARADEVIE